MESRGTVLANTRRKINAAKSRLQKSWEDVFGSCDKDKSGSLDYREFEEGVRTILNLPANAVCHNDLRTIFNEIDVDGSGGVNIEELLGYLTKGYRTPEEIASRAQVRIQRVRRALKMAFQNLATNDAALKKLFYKVDMDGDSSLSLYEFKTFVRMDLKLSFWDVNNSDAEEFYRHLDANNANGVTVEELIAAVRTNSTSRTKHFSFTAEPLTPTNSRPSSRQSKRKTFKQTLLEESFRSASMPDLSKMRYTASVVSRGRERMPATRSSLSKDSQMFFDPGGPERRLRQGS